MKNRDRRMPKLLCILFKKYEFVSEISSKNELKVLTILRNNLPSIFEKLKRFSVFR